MDELAGVTTAAHDLAGAISRRDSAAIRELLTSDFVLRTPGQGAADVEAFVAGIQQIPGEIVFVQLENLVIDVHAGIALATGIQRVQLRLDGKLVDDACPFVDWFVRGDDGRWRVRVAVDLSAPQ